MKRALRCVQCGRPNEVQPRAKKEEEGKPYKTFKKCVPAPRTWWGVHTDTLCTEYIHLKKGSVIDALKALGVPASSSRYKKNISWNAPLHQMRCDHWTHRILWSLHRTPSTSTSSMRTRTRHTIIRPLSRNALSLELLGNRTAPMNYRGRNASVKSPVEQLSAQKITTASHMIVSISLSAHLFKDDICMSHAEFPTGTIVNG